MIANHHADGRAGRSVERSEERPALDNRHFETRSPAPNGGNKNMNVRVRHLQRVDRLLGGMVGGCIEGQAGGTFTDGTVLGLRIVVFIVVYLLIRFGCPKVIRAIETSPILQGIGTVLFWPDWGWPSGHGSIWGGTGAPQCPRRWTQNS